MCKALSTWKAMRSSQDSRNCWSILEPPCPSSFHWDEDSEFISVSNLNVLNPSHYNYLNVNRSLADVDKTGLSNDHDFGSLCSNT
uniref:Uncharacterized protein n=1 Tax=Schistosoma japonicum TaxID=6182 RepID=Q86EW9_SCHJA|nr:hypothetical protein [Schistosoma japonicum]